MKKFISALLVTAILASSLLMPVSVSSNENKFSIHDALNILKHLTGIQPLTAAQMITYDVDGTPGVDIYDALEILRYLAGLPNKIGVFVPPATVATTTTAKTAGTVIVPTAQERAFANEVLALVNAERAKEGLAALSMTHTGLNNAAMKRAEEIISTFSHDRPDGTSWSSVLAEYDVPGGTAGENIAMGYRTPESVVTGWMDSPGHRRNIMSTSYTHIGIGVSITSGGVPHWVQLFLKV